MSLEELTRLDDNRLPIMVVSHERSGTHYMMNTLAACFDYVSDPWLNIDRPQININYFDAHALEALIRNLAEAKPANIIKVHHELAFYRDIVVAMEGVMHIIYILRNPADVMASYWRFLHTWNWVEGPTTETALAFAKMPPMGQLMRFQFRQYETMLDRWANHVRQWVQASSQSTNIHLVKYENLTLHYEDTVRALGAAIGLEPRRIVQPSPNKSVVQAGDVNFVPAPGSDNRDAIMNLAMAKFPDLMESLGYDQSVYRFAHLPRRAMMR